VTADGFVLGDMSGSNIVQIDHLQHLVMALSLARRVLVHHPPSFVAAATSSKIHTEQSGRNEAVSKAGEKKK